ncbi:MAG: polysulfide reductase NrfD [Nitrospirae bacterium]|nr:polysulfide reductase NrfD [Nitrospirota bacterium]
MCVPVSAVFFSAVCPGFFISSAIFDYLQGLWAAQILNFLGYGVAHMLFAGRISRFRHTAFIPRNSWISWGFLFNAAFSVFGVLYAASRTWNLPVADPEFISGLLFFLSVSSAVLFAAHPGFMHSTVKAIPFWRSMLEPMIFFLQGVLGGTALHLVSLYWVGSEMSAARILLKTNLFIAIAVMLMFSGALIMKSMHGCAVNASVWFLPSGALLPVFIGGTVVSGLAVPIAIIIAGRLVNADPATPGLIYPAAMTLELIGIYLGKYGVICAGAYGRVTKPAQV